MFIFYDLIFVLFSILYLPYLFLKGKWHKDFLSRFGFLRKDALAPSSQKRIWVHAVSVGEVIMTKDLLGRLRKCFPSNPLVVTTVTKTGYAMAVSVVEGQGTVLFAPLDLSFAVNRYLRLIDPLVFVNAETELWPNILRALHRRKVPVIQVNGRISDRAWGRYRLAWPLLKIVLGYVDRFGMQSERDAKRIIALGAAPSRVSVTGNIKFDDVSFDSEMRPCGLAADEALDLFVAGSTHPGEEEILLMTFQTLKKDFSSLRLILAPRHPERSDEIAKLVSSWGLKPVKFSQIYDLIVDQDTVVIVDTIGHLRSLYSLAKIVFVGKSLTVKGGHNIIEPAYLEKPVIIGPHMQNFRDITEAFVKNEAVVQVRSAQELTAAARALLRDEARCEELGLKAREVIESSRGATEKTLALILSAIKSANPVPAKGPKLQRKAKK